MQEEQKDEAPAFVMQEEEKVMDVQAVPARVPGPIDPPILHFE